jgi:signal transduction histidine kinase
LLRGHVVEKGMDGALQNPQILSTAATDRRAGETRPTLTVSADPSDRGRAAEPQAPFADDLLDALPVAVVAVTRDLSVTAANSEAARLLELSAADGRPLPEPWVEFSLRRFARTLCASGAFPAEARARIHEGRVVEVLGRPVPGGAVLVIREVARARDEEADRAFVGNAAHELRASLGGIASAVEALELGAKEQPRERDHLLDGVATEVRALRRQVDALLVLARAHAEPRALALEPVAMAPLVERVAETLTVRPGVEVETACDERTAVRGMRPLLEIALRNMARNAARYTRGTITLSCRRLTGDRVAIEVADDGPGIAREARDGLFERFVRGNDGGDGFGIGLPLTREIVRLLDGDVDVESDATGTTVRLVLPAA